MNKKHLFCVAGFLIVLSCKSKDTAPHTTKPNNQHISVLTQHNNNTRSGLNDHETVLRDTNVNANRFGRLFNLPVDDQVYAQPLVVGNVAMSGTSYNVVYIATVNNTIYAYDADGGSLFWKKNYTSPGMRPPKNSDMTQACGGLYYDFSGNIGIVGTPVIDSISQTIYFVARSTNNGNSFVQYLHAVDITTGNERTGSPVMITATYTGNGDGSNNNQIIFDAQRQNQRQALTLTNGVLYVTFSSHCDWGPYHGWILGYNASTLQQQVVYNDSPDGYNAGLWESGTGMAVDDGGSLYIVTGNGSVGINNDPANPRNRGESAMKLSVAGATLNISSYFTPFNFDYLEANDLDYGCMGSFLIPNSNYFFTGAKDGNLYLLNKDNMGGYQAATNQVQQTIFLNANANQHCQPSYYKGTNKEYVFIWSENDALKGFLFNRSTNMFDVGSTVAGMNGPGGQNGAMLAVSSNANTSGTGILWASYSKGCDAEHSVCPGILRAFNADDITQELWNSDQSASDAVGNYAKFASPTIANGHVYLATFSGYVAVYGLK
ncbi:MAG: hypothetical protein JST47_06235 [Bacteroidetes bacterium]|nr:hypothetical protein [Bacteroidota bacterium]MBS1973317.1 hypothetical protein [Bacteroidota bacterium]